MAEEKRAPEMRMGDVKCVRCQRIFKQLVVISVRLGTLAGICPDCRNPKTTLRPET